MNTILKLAGVVLFISLSSISVFSQENSTEENANQKRTVEQIRAEQMFLQKQIRMEALHYRESLRALNVELKQALRARKLEKEKSKKNAASFHLLALILEGGLKFDYSRSLTHKQWLQITPVVYLYSPDYLTSDLEGEYCIDIEKVQGAGLDIRYKYHPFTNRFFSLNAGAGYSYVDAEYEKYDYLPFKEDGLNYYRGVNQMEHQYFNNLKIFTCMGIQTPMHKYFFVGANLGIGYQYSFYDSKKPLGDDDAVFDFGYRGIYPVIEFRMGVTW